MVINLILGSQTRTKEDQSLIKKRGLRFIVLNLEKAEEEKKQKIEQERIEAEKKRAKEAEL